MYEFPTLEGHQTKKRVLAYLEAMGLVPLRIEKLAPSKHVFSHREWHMIGYVIRVDELHPKAILPNRNNGFLREQMKPRRNIPCLLPMELMRIF